LKIAAFRQTPFITHDEQNQVQILVTDWDFCNPFRVTIAVGDTILYDGPMFQVFFSVLIPVPTESCECTVTVTPFEDTPVTSAFSLHPPKRWRIGLVYSSHEDIGYCAWVNKLEYESYQFLMEAIQLCEQHEGFRYMIEHVWWLEAFQRYATAEECERLRRLFAEKKIELNAIHCGYHTHWAEGEQLIRGVSFATVHAAETWGITPTAAVFTDLSGASWQTIPAYAGQGIRYVGVLENGGFRKPDLKGNPPPVFRWSAQNGKDSLLGWYQVGYRGRLGGIWCDTNRQYPEGTFFFDESKTLKTEAAITDILTPLRNAPYDILPYSFYDDREKPTTMLLTVCDYMNKKWKYPHFSMELPSVMFAEIEKQSGDRLPSFSGDLTDQWGDFATIAPLWMSQKRRAMRKMITAETLSALSAVQGKPYDAEAFRKITRYGCLFDEHCWATSSKHPQKMHRFNLAYVKKHSAERALAIADEKLAEVLGTPGEMLGLRNPLPTSRRTPLRLDAALIPDGLAVQQVGNELLTEPVSFAPMELKQFGIRQTPLIPASPISGSFETDYYRVSIDKVSKKICSIFDKTNGKELIDPAAPYGIGDYVYVVTEAKTGRDLSYEVAKCREFAVEEGEVAFVITRKAYEEQSGADVSARFVFYKHAPDIDILLQFSDATGLMGDYYDRYKKNIFFAFPFAVKNHQFYTQLAGGRAHSANEKMNVCPLDFSIAEEWVAVEGETGGIGVRSEDMPVFHFSQINYNQFLSRPEYPKSHLYLYAASNRTNNLNFCAPEDCAGTYRLTLLPYAGHCEDTLPQWSRALAQPVLCGDLREIPRLTLDKELRLMSCRIDGAHSLLLRFAEESGKPQENVKLTLPFAPTRAVLTTLHGKERESLRVEGSDVFFSVLGGEYCTLRVYGDFTVVPATVSEEPICDVFQVPVENSRSIVCFTKTKDLKAAGFSILGDGQVLAELPNNPEATQTVELNCRPEQIEIRIIP